LDQISVSLDGVLTAVLMWLLASVYAALGLAFCVIGLRTGRDKLWGRRMIFSFALAGALWLGSFQLRHLPQRALRVLDELYLAWVFPAFLLGLWAFFKIGRRE